LALLVRAATGVWPSEVERRANVRELPKGVSSEGLRADQLQHVIASNLAARRFGPGAATLIGQVKERVLPGVFDESDLVANALGISAAIREAQRESKMKEATKLAGRGTLIRGHEGGKVPLAPPMLKQLAEVASTKHGVPVDLILAIIQAESSGRPGAFNPEKGGNPSTGLMQLRFTTAQGLGYKGKQEGLYDPAVNVDLGAKYLAQQMKRYKGDLASTISSYNAGTAKRNKTGTFINQKYVDKVTGFMKPPAPPQGTIDAITGTPGVPGGFGFIRGD